MRKFVPLTAAALVAVAAVGCKPKPEDQVVGTWSGMGSGSVTINKDKTWTANMPTAPGMPGDIKGSWTIEGNTLNMKFDTIGGQPVQTIVDLVKKMSPKDAPKADELLKGLQVQLSEDGKSLASSNAGPNGSKLTLTKQGG
jgi:hypothetical protein